MQQECKKKYMQENKEMQNLIDLMPKKNATKIKKGWIDPESIIQLK